MTDNQFKYIFLPLITAFIVFGIFVIVHGAKELARMNKEVVCQSFEGIYYHGRTISVDLPDILVKIDKEDGHYLFTTDQCVTKQPTYDRMLDMIK